jgi:hypothetical protein
LSAAPGARIPFGVLGRLEAPGFAGFAAAGAAAALAEALGWASAEAAALTTGASLLEAAVALGVADAEGALAIAALAEAFSGAAVGAGEPSLHATTNMGSAARSEARRGDIMARHLAQASRRFQLCGRARSCVAGWSERTGRRRMRAMRSRLRLGSTVLALTALGALTMVATLTTGCKKHEDPIAVPVDAPPPTTPAVAREPDVRGAATLSAALDEARAKMGDGPAPSEGALLLAAWADRALDWADVDRQSETSAARVLERPSSERGKRLCASGEIAEIADFDASGTKVHAGRLVADPTTTLHFLAVRSVGTLAPRGRARVCGIVTGVIEPNDGKGSPMVQLVGLFDLADNRRSLDAKAPAAYAPRATPAPTASAAADPGTPKRTVRTISSSL